MRRRRITSRKTATGQQTSKPKRGTASKAARNRRVKNTEVARLARELAEARDQQTATSAILRVISRSQTNVQPVFDAILSSAVRLLRGYSGVVTRSRGRSHRARRVHERRRR